MQPNIFSPYGVSSFEKLTPKSYVFTDKTPYIEKVENEDYISFLPPPPPPLWQEPFYYDARLLLRYFL
jgi:hypothetical protein